MQNKNFTHCYRQLISYSNRKYRIVQYLLDDVTVESLAQQNIPFTKK